MLKEIKEYLKSNSIEEAYNLIIKCEYEYKNYDYYWELRGDLCFLVREYETALNCYNKSLSLNYRSKDVITKCLDICEILDLKEKQKDYKKMLQLTRERIKCEFVDILLNAEIDNMNIKALFDIMNENMFYYNNGYLYQVESCININKISEELKKRISIIVRYDIEYKESVKKIAKEGFEKCSIMFLVDNKILFTEIENNILKCLVTEEYKKCITINVLNAADSNSSGMIKYMPEKYKTKYKLNIIQGWDVLSIENKIKVPLKSLITIGGFEMFLQYPSPSLTYNIEVGHGPMSFKAVGAMSKKYKDFSFNNDRYKELKKICVTSNTDMLMYAATTGCSEEKFLISGLPRNDMLIKSDGKKNLEKLLQIDIRNKKVILNMPTFHKHDATGITQGDSELINYVKIKNFDYDKFDEFLGLNDMICIMKGHHAEERSLQQNENQYKKYENIHFINNSHLDKIGLDLYEIINAGDMLITDYSSIYNDFIFMNKPTIFTNCDIDKYRREVGLLLEPYDFWAAGPKVTTQEELQLELLKCCSNKYYQEERERIRPLFFDSFEFGATERIWNYIDEVYENELK
ncbi:CDP-glycerol glycerophosphotransferase family protein [Clostridium butyricum]|uniref:CDP-glycerol glycerophosphotransferase family protein n=1 Tax=Clostridium butyricum TaxID=1492 RepID=UPI0018AB812C